VRITDVLAVPVRGGFFTDDQAAIVAGAPHDGFGYAGTPVTPGFRTIRQPAQALSVLLVLEDGSVEHGDCAAVQYSGVGGRDPVLDAATARDVVLGPLADELRGRDVTGFRDVAEELAALPVHTAVGYGVSQALLAVAARAQRRTMAEVVRDEWATGVELAAVPLYAQSGDDRHTGAEKMLLHGVDVLPHGLFNSVELVGADGGRLADYLRWLVARAGELAPGATPRLHVDVYGTLGLAFGGDVPAVAAYLAALGEACTPFPLAVEHPMDGGSRDGQLALMAALRAELARLGSPVQVVVDEWCNTVDDVRAFLAAGAADVVQVKTPDLGSLVHTVEALLAVRAAGARAFCGGSCAETDRSAQVTAHVAMACGAAQVLAKPGMGVDEGLMVVGNEMARVLALAGRPR